MPADKTILHTHGTLGHSSGLLLCRKLGSQKARLDR